MRDIKMNLLTGFILAIALSWHPFSQASTVSLDDKIGQMLIIGFEGKTAHASSVIAKSIQENNIGGVILFDYNMQTEQYDKNIESPQQVKLLNQQLQQLTHQANQTHHREDLALLITVDYEGGVVNRLREDYGFPTTVSAKDMGEMSIERMQEHAKTMASTLQSAGFNLDFAPVLDVNVNPDNPVIGQLDRSFSEQPEQVSLYAGLFAQQLLAQGVQCAYKHFPGHGSSSSDSHLGFVDISDTWQERELIPYQQSLAQKQHCGFIMSAHVVNKKLDATGLPATLSYQMLTKLLRQELQFEGVIITDDMQMKAIADHYGLAEALSLAINAGADMFIFGNQLSDTPQDPKEIIQLIKEKVARGEIAEARINEAYQRIVKLKRQFKG